MGRLPPYLSIYYLSSSLISTMKEFCHSSLFLLKSIVFVKSVKNKKRTLLFLIKLIIKISKTNNIVSWKYVAFLVLRKSNKWLLVVNLHGLML